jgi:signal transduction histidine kinase/HPt (histidine-containing phosphotransfer) domain-containing protein/ActR/RegA family two-component response regulator
MSRVREAALQLASQLGVPLRQEAIPNTYDQAWRPDRTLLGFSVLVVLALATLFTADLVRQYRTTLDDANRSALSYANIIAEHTARSFEAADNMLKEAALVRGDLSAGEFTGPQALKDTLLHLRRTSPLVMALGWTDKAGNLLAHSYPKDPPRPNISDLPHFIAQRDASSDELYVSPPFKSAVTGQWICAISRRLTDSMGHFAGIVTAPIDPTYFNSIYRSLDIGNRGRVVLVHRDERMIIAREPAEPNLVGISYTDQTDSLNSRLAQASGGTYDVLSRFDGQHRIVAYKAVAGLPLVVMVTLARADVLAPWYHQLIVVLLTSALLVFVIIVGTIFLSRQANRIGEQAHMLATTLDSMDQGLIMLDANNTVQLCNNRAIELLGLPADLMASRPDVDAVLAFQKNNHEFDSATEEVRRVLLPGVRSSLTYAYERVRPNSTALEIRTSPLANGGLVRTYTDVTVRNAIRLALEQQKERAEAATRAKSDFLATMSHELRTPLAAIVGASDFLLGGVRSPEQQRPFLEIQRDASKVLLGVVNDILDFSKIEAGQIELESVAFSLRRLAEECIGVLSNEAKVKNLKLAVDVERVVPEAVLGDETRLQEVLLNLLTNAVKFTETGSVHLRISADAGGSGGIRFAVSDTGIGIEPDRLPAIFESFTQADNSTTRRFGGSGLGLAISKRLVELMGGNIVVESVVGRGSTFWFVAALPSAQLPSSSPPAERRSEQGRRGRILLAEDTASSRLVIETMVCEAGYDVTSVAGGREAIRAADKVRFDVVLMDVRMPEVDGYEAARAIRKRYPTIGIIGLTATAQSDERERCLAAGMDACAFKPVNWGSLLATIQRLIARNSEATLAPATPVSQPLDAFEARIGSEKLGHLLNLFEADASRCFVANAAHDDLEGIAADAHKLAGSAGLLGFDELQLACSALEAAITHKQPIEGKLAACRSARDAALAAIHARSMRSARKTQPELVFKH